MGGNAKQTILPMAMGIGAGFLMPGGTATTGMFGELVGGAAFNSTAALIGGGLASAMFAETPQVPDFSSNFAEQSAFINTQQSFSRQGDSQLESLLASGTEYEKNQAFDELRRRGADENRLAEISTAQGRSAERQAEIDQYTTDNAPPSTEEIEILAQTLAAERQAGFDEDLDLERTRLKQVSAQRGTLDSNRNDDLNLRLASIGAQNRSSITNAALKTATGFQSDIQGIANQGYNRLLKGSSLAEEQSRFDLGLTEAERRYQENLRTARTSDQRNVAFQNFQSDLDRQIAVFQQRSQDSRSEAQLGLGIAQAGLISPRDPFAPKPTGTTKAGEKLNTQYDIFKNHASPLVPTIPSNGGTGFGGGKLYGS
tara:strand:+ start:3447 stop:4556 length:1110 start_codon:yes stop_codon:yes gene_type:complete